MIYDVWIFSVTYKKTRDDKFSSFSPSLHGALDSKAKFSLRQSSTVILLLCREDLSELFEKAVSRNLH